jgi:hypothetical protein
MTRYFAIPIDVATGDDRTDKEAREATVSGDYVSEANFKRYAFARRSTLPGQYNFYMKVSDVRRVYLGRLYRLADSGAAQ